MSPPPRHDDPDKGNGAQGAAESQLRWFMEQIPSLLWATDRDLRLTTFLSAGLEQLPAVEGGRQGQDLHQLFATDSKTFPPIQAAFQALEGTTQSLEFEWLGRVFESRVEPVRSSTSAITGCLGVALDITERRQAEQALGLQEAYFQQLFENSPQGILVLDPSDRVIKVNRGFEELFGYGAEEVCGRPLTEAIVPLERRDEATALSRAVLYGEVVRMETERRHRDGRLIAVSIIGYPIRFDGDMIGVYGIYNDITERKRAEERLLHDALHDSLTGLPNRSYFTNRVRHCLQLQRHKPGFLFAILFLDLDRFKLVNDSLGHGLGDRLLIAFAKRLRGSLAAKDVLARLGGDEFVILLEGIQDASEAEVVAHQIQRELVTPFDLEGIEVFTATSIGISISSSDYQHPEEPIRDADTAMYRAKAKGRACHAVFDTEMHAQAMNRLQLETDLRRAMARREFRVFYQPIVDLKSGAISGFEALLRWHHPIRGLLLPGQFFAVAEETGLTVKLSEFVLNAACRQLHTWQQREQPVGISVNLSTKQFLQQDLIRQLDALVEDYALEPGGLGLEITEGVILHGSESAVDILNTLKSSAVRLYLDDFGTGYSSLSYLQNFPIDTLKIDRSFISGKAGRGGRPEIVRAIINLAHSLGIDVVAEGIETSGQLADLRALGCEYGQGFLFAPALDAEGASALLEEGRTW
ncbi:MAG: EAL domain-containing protein [Deltaproteobacteria bacterium]|nr:EAL domain-containing protein [Deltaproteobacteria bacterium]